MLLVFVTLDQQVHVMDDEENEQHGDTATDCGHVGASQRTIDLGVTHLDRQSCKKETIERIKEETAKNIMLYLNGQVDHKYEEMVDQEGEQEGDFVVS